jgi:DNA-binding NarL/FixJ family response regulator
MLAAGIALPSRAGEDSQVTPEQVNGCPHTVRSARDHVAPTRRHTIGGVMTEPPKPIRIAIIEDNRLVRDGLTALLNQMPDLRVISARASDDGWPVGASVPDVVLLDLGLRKGDSLRSATRVRAKFPDARVIVMDLLPAAEDIVDFVNVGVAGFIMKDATLEDLATAIRAVASGVAVLPQLMVSTLFSQIARDAVQQSRGNPHDAVRMTPRERQVIDLIAEGLSNKEIAARLHVATHTVKSHVRNVMEKLTLHTRLQIAAYAHGEPRPKQRKAPISPA